jgi:signal transduction histidine kinase
MRTISRGSGNLFRVALLLILSVPAWVILFVGLRRSHRPFSSHFLLYVVGYVLFGFVFWLAAGKETGPRGRSWRLAALLLQSGLALSLVWLICSGLEGSLLVVVAAQVAAIFPLPLALGWIAAQSAVMAWIIGLHWPPSVLYPLFLAWLGAQAFAALMSRALANEAQVRNELAQRNAELRATQQLLADSSRAAERVRIARELHDVLGHHLTAVSLNLEVASHLIDGQGGEHIQKAQAGTKQLLREVRHVVSRLRGDDSPNVSRAIELLVRDVPEPHIHLRVGDAVTIGDPLRAEALLRCVQEVVTNAIKHSAASDLWIEITETAAGVEVHARDNGRGVQHLYAGHGLTGMRERIEQVGGRLQLDSAPSAGFRVEAYIPTRGPLR